MYVVFEGNDGSGKSTTMRAVAEAVRERIKGLTLHLTHHPGSTPLGKHLRALVKFPEEFDPNIAIDPLSLQLLYMVDAVSFTKQILEPAISAGEWVFADRSNHISSMVYGMAEGLELVEVEKLFNLIQPPKADKVYVLRCPWKVGKDRLTKRGERLDHFERKSTQFFQRVEANYNNLVCGSLEQTMLVSKVVDITNIVYIDADLPSKMVVDKIVDDILSAAKEK